VFSGVNADHNNRKQQQQSINKAAATEMDERNGMERRQTEYDTVRYNMISMSYCKNTIWRRAEEEREDR